MPGGYGSIPERVIEDVMLLKVRAASWSRDRADLVREVDAALEELGANRCPDPFVRGESRDSRHELPLTFPVVERRGEPAIQGVDKWIVLRDADGARVTRWQLFENGDARFGADPFTTIATSVERARRDALEVLAPGTLARIDGMGEVEVERSISLAPFEDLVTELRDQLDRNHLGKPGLIKRARVAMADWKRTRSTDDFDRLRAAYEAVPRHRRNSLDPRGGVGDKEYRAALHDDHEHRFAMYPSFS